MALVLPQTRGFFPWPADQQATHTGGRRPPCSPLPTGLQGLLGNQNQQQMASLQLGLSLWRYSVTCVYTPYEWGFTLNPTSPGRFSPLVLIYWPLRKQEILKDLREKRMERARCPMPSSSTVPRDNKSSSCGWSCWGTLLPSLSPLHMENSFLKCPRRAGLEKLSKHFIPCW